MATSGSDLGALLGRDVVSASNSEFSFKGIGYPPIGGYLPYSHLDPHLHIIMEVEVWIGSHWIKTFVMIDSGSSANVIDSRFEAALNRTPIHKPHAIKYTMADGETSTGGTVTHDVTTELKIGLHQESLTLDITKLHSIPCFKRYDPWIQWSQHLITFNSPFCLTNCKLDDAYTATALSNYPAYTTPVLPTNRYHRSAVAVGRHSSVPRPRCRVR